MQSENEGDLWEVFVQSETGAPHEHVGSVHATDGEMALQNARDAYARRGNVVSIWVVPSQIHHSDNSRGHTTFLRPGRRQGLPPSSVLQNT